MTKKPALQRVDDDIRRGYLGSARNRLHGLIAENPRDLSLRPRLAEIYWQLRHPAMAGLYWFLDSKRNDDIRTAIAEFERECGGDPWIMLRRFKLGWNIADMPDGFAKEQLHLLADQCLAKHKRLLPLPAGLSADKRKKKPTRLRELAMLLGCGLLAFVLLCLMLAGVVQFVIWFWK